MQEFTAFLKEHKPVVILVCVALALFLAFSVFSFVRTQNAQQLAQQGQTESVETDAGESLDQSQADADSQLPDDLKAKRNSYSDDTKEFIAILSAQMWGTDGASPYISFTDKTYTESDVSGDEETHGYVINTLEKDTAQGSGTQTVTYLAAFENESDTFFVSLTKTTGSDNKVSYELKSDSFKESRDAYTPVTPSDSFEVAGLTDDVLALVNNDKDGLNAAVADYCAQFYPTAKDLTWSEYATISWATNQVTLPIRDGSSSHDVLVAVYDMSNQTWTASSYRMNG